MNEENQGTGKCNLRLVKVGIAHLLVEETKDNVTGD